MNHWWKNTVFYQIYMPSFCDGNADGIGDFIGIRSKLPYLKHLGVGCIWLTPFYKSPKVDHGYDVADYRSIDPDYGTMEDFRQFIAEAHELGIRVISDIVLNHTSTEHEWFQESRSSLDNPKRDWYIWKKPLNGQKPNNWESFFGESAWEWDEKTGEYYYHSFAREQVDLNWANPQVEQAMFDMLDFWIDQGIDGFRLDVINNLTLTDNFQNNPIGDDGKQLHLYDVNQPGIHEWMRKFENHIKQRGNIFLVGEISSDELERIHSYAVDDQLDTTFNFNIGSIPSFEFQSFKEELEKMSRMYSGKHQPTIFFGSHDMPRVSGRFHFDDAQTKSLFTLMMTFRAYPFIYFGDEIGMKNYICHTVEDAHDIRGVIAYHQAKERGENEEICISLLNEESRDHSRNTMYWSSKQPNGGFSTATPWIGFQEQPIASAEEQQQNEDSMFNCLAKLIRLRSELDILAEGDCTISSPQDEVIVCTRRSADCELRAVINFGDQSYSFDFNKNEKILFETQKRAVHTGDGNRLTLDAKNSVILLWNTQG